MITIREMTFDDLDEVAAIDRSLFTTPWSATGFFSFLIRDDTLLLVAQEEDAIVGYCGVMMVLDEGDITNVAVLANRQRKGIGRQLVQALLRETALRGVTRLHLEVRESNAPAIRLYENLDFARVGVRKGYYEAPTEDGILMTHCG